MSAGRAILALDGHDGSGKTTLALRLADSLGAEYVRPFAGERGPQLLALAAGNPGEAMRFARDVFAEAAESARRDVLVFDRHWMTVCSLLPEAPWRLWTDFPPTALCWADLPATLSRLAGRREPPEAVAEHQRYLRVYWELGRRFPCFVLRTDREPEDRSLARLLEWSAGYLPRPEAS